MVAWADRIAPSLLERLLVAAWPAADAVDVELDDDHVMFRIDGRWLPRRGSRRAQSGDRGGNCASGPGRGPWSPTQPVSGVGPECRTRGGRRRVPMRAATSLTRRISAHLRSGR